MTLSTGRARFVKSAAIAVATALTFGFAAAVPASAAEASDPIEISAEIVAGSGFTAGKTVKIKFSATNTSKKTVTLDKDAAVVVTAPILVDATVDPTSMTGGFKIEGAGPLTSDYDALGYVAELPTKMKAGQAISGTLSYKTTATDVKKKGIFALASYAPQGVYAEGWEEYFTYVTVPAKGSHDTKLTGKAVFGQKLGVKMGYTGIWKSDLDYQWYRNGYEIKGATKSTYKLTKADLGKRITVSVIAVAEDGSWAEFVPNETKKVAKAKLKTVTPKITGTAKVGKTVKTKVTGWTKGTKISYQWYANGKKIKGATKSSVKLTKSQAGKKITVKVTGKKTGYTTVTKTSKKTASVKK